MIRISVETIRVVLDVKDASPLVANPRELIRAQKETEMCRLTLLSQFRERLHVLPGMQLRADEETTFQSFSL